MPTRTPGAIASPAKILPAGKYVVESVVPPGYELVKEEDKNILIGDNWVASSVISPQFATIADIFIVPDQASINQNNINGVYNAAMYSNFSNSSYVGPNSGQPLYNSCGTGGCSNGNFSQPTDDDGPRHIRRLRCGRA